ncbi:MAG: TPM domain-containing protein [Acidobacteriota bacterium]
MMMGRATTADSRVGLSLHRSPGLQPAMRAGWFWRLGVLLFVLSTVASHCLLAQIKLKPTGYVNDFTGTIDETSRRQIEGLCRQVEEKTGAQIAVAVVASLEGRPIEDYAVDLFKQWSVGQKGQNNGLLLLVAMQDRKSRIEVGYGLEPVITDGFSGDVLRAIRPFFRANQYGQGLYEAVQMLSGQIARAAGVELGGERAVPASRSSRSRQTLASLPVLLILLALFFLPRLLNGRGSRGSRYYSGHRYRRGGYYGGLGGLGGFGGFGGFGGGDSGGFGGFGGFGGGESGGGGSSGSW